MLQLDVSTTRALTERFKHCYGNIPALPQPVLIIFDYSPTDNDPQLSIAFDGDLGAKCWMSEENVRLINGIRPNRMSNYKDYSFKGHHFYGFSVQPFSQSDFDDIDQIERICRMLYTHSEWPNS